MRLIRILILALAIFTMPLQAQLNKCLSNVAVLEMEKNFPGYKAAVDFTYEQAQENQSAKTAGEVYTIPVVFHIVYNTAQENLSDELIEAQIETLNQDFRRQNPNADETRPVFLDVAADAEMQFELASFDPEGNVTNGIVRTQTDRDSFIEFELDLAGILAAAEACDIDITQELTDEDLECILGQIDFGGAGDPVEQINEVKSSLTGGSDPWDQDRYLNIWVCNMSINLAGEATPFILGFAYPPVEAPNWPDEAVPDNVDAIDGVTVHYQAIGPNNPDVGALADLNDQGRTIVHEVGHYLGLRHIWGDGDCSEDDGLSDTPSAGSNSQPTDTAIPSCEELHEKDSCTGDELPDMIENYMDYSIESCQNLFTAEQVGIMRSMLEGPRSGLIQNFAGIDDVESRTLSVFPNPVDQLLNVKYQEDGLISYRLINEAGQIMLSGKELNAQINLKSFAEGLYFLELIYPREKASQSFFVKH